VIRYSITTVLLLLAAIVVQQMLPVFTGLHQSRILLVQLVFICCAVTVHQPVMLLLAFLGGFLWDAQSALAPHGGDPDIYSQQVETLRFGYSILLFGGMGMLMLGIQPLFHEGRWRLSTAIAGLAVLLYLVTEYAILSFVRGGIVIHQETILQIVFTAALTMLFAPPLFWLLNQVAALFGHSIQPHVNRRRRRAF
jgi:hypothetical protein